MRFGIKICNLCLKCIDFMNLLWFNNVIVVLIILYGLYLFERSFDLKIDEYSNF